MWGAAPILFWCAPCSGTLVWARPAAATTAGAGPAASPPPRVAVPSGGGGGVPSAPGGRRAALVAPNLRGVRGGVGRAAPPPLRPVGRRPAFRCPWRAPPGVYSRRGGCRAAAGFGRGPVGRQRVSAAGGGGEGGGTPPALVRAPIFPGPASDKAAPFAPSCAVGRQQAGRVGACLGRGTPAPGVQRPLRGGVRGRRFFGLPLSALGPEWEGAGGEWGGPLVPWRRLLTAGGGAAWWSWPWGPAIGWGVAPFPRPPLPRAGPSCRPSFGPLIPPAVVARRWPARGGREG